MRDKSTIEQMFDNSDFLCYNPHINRWSNDTKFVLWGGLQAAAVAAQAPLQHHRAIQAKGRASA